MVSCKYKTLFCLLYYTQAFAACDNTDALPRPKDISDDLYNEIFSETDVFYRPGSNVPVPLISKPATATKDRGPKGVYGWLPCFCHQEACSCCVDIRIKALNAHDSGCITISPSNYDNSTVDTGITLNNKTIMQERLSFENAPPLCLPFPPFPAISICVRLYQIMREGRNIKACVNFELRITGTLNPLWTLQFTCVKFGFGGITFFRPSTTSTTPKTVFVFPTQEESPQFFYFSQYNVPAAYLI